MASKGRGSKPKAAQDCEIKYLLSAQPGKVQEGRFIQVVNSLFFSKAFQGLTSGARWLYLCMVH